MEELEKQEEPENTENPEKKEKKKRKKLHEVSLEEDIKYRGPLSYRHLKIFGWLCIAVSQMLVLISFFNSLSPGAVVLSTPVTIILALLASMPIPVFLLANCSLILDSDKGYKALLFTNGVGAAAIIALFLFLYFRYGIGIAGAFLGDKQAAVQVLDQLFSSGTQNGKMVFNVFVDFFLCTLFMFFVNYKPKRFFTGKKIFLFRSFAVFPFLYEVASLVLKYLAARKIIIMPVYMLPFLTTKPLLLFLVFIVLAIFIKNRERLFCKTGRTHEEYQLFLKTNRNSLHFSIFTAIVFLIAGLIDLVLYSALLYLQANGSAEIAEIINSLGLGKGTIGLLILAPFVLLFSYTRKYKGRRIDMLIPVGGIALIIFIYLEGIFQAITTLLSGGLK